MRISLLGNLTAQYDTFNSDRLFFSFTNGMVRRSRYWRTRLLKLSDAELGLDAVVPSVEATAAAQHAAGADANGGGENEGLSAQRQALYTALDFCKTQFQRASSGWGEGASYQFNFRPGKPKSEAWKAAMRKVGADKKRKREAAMHDGHGQVDSEST